MDRGNHRVYFLAGIILALVLNLEPLFLRDGFSVGELYLSSTFSLDYFLEEQQFFFAIKQLFAIFLCCFFYGGKIKKSYTIYTILRLKKKWLWLAKQFLLLGFSAFSFFGMYGLGVWMICIISCQKLPNIQDWYIFLVSMFAFSYMGFVSAAISNVLAFYLKERNAVLFSYITIGVGAFLSMWGCDFFGEYPVLGYINPITAMSLMDDGGEGIFWIGVVLILLVFVVFSMAGAFFCRKSEKIWTMEE